MKPYGQGTRTLDRRSFLGQARLGAGAWLAHTLPGLEAADAAGSLQIQPYPLIPEAAPLPPSRLAERLAEDPGLTNRNLFVVGSDGKITYRAIPFREIDPTAYKELGAAIGR